MSSIGESIMAMGIMFFIFLIFVAVVVLIAVIYYGAIAFVILWLLEKFGVLAALGV